MKKQKDEWRERRETALHGSWQQRLELLCSAPHGAGRLMNRKDAEQSFTLSQFKKSMDGIFTTSVSKDTIDESPFVYKTMDEILKNISDTVTVDIKTHI